jgi:hypothetical protein
MLETDATVGALNTLLANVGATIEGSSPGDEILPNGLLTLGLPTSDFEDLMELAEQLNAEGIVRAAAPEMLMGLTAVTRDDNGTSGALPDDRNPEDGENVVAGLTSPVGGSLIWKWDKAGVHEGGNWGLERTRVPEMWNLKEAVEKNKNEKVKIGVIDGGFPGHLDVPIRPATTEDRSGANPGHGLHVAGIIGATHDNNMGIDGVTPFADMTGFTSSTARFYTNGMNANRFLKDVRRVLSTVSGVRIINLSQGFNWSKQQPWSQFRAPQVSSAMGMIFAELAASNPNVLIVCTAGNDGQEFPALYCSPMSRAALDPEYGVGNIIVVEGLAPDGSLYSESNIGGHVRAPGRAILSAVDGDGYGLKSGTSQAAPFVAGLAGFLMSVDSSLKPPDLIDLISINGLEVDAFVSAMSIDNFRGGKKVLKMLLNIDDGTVDGNLRVKTGPPQPNRDRSFEEVIQGAQPEYVAFEGEDADGDGGMGDTRFDMSDFRRWRDWLLLAEKFGGGSGADIALNGSITNLKHDANRDGEAVLPEEGDVHPRGDFNGDGKAHRSDTREMPGLLNDALLTDLQVLTQSGLWAMDEDYDVNDLPNLIDSVDITVSAENFFAKYPEITEGVVGIYDVATQEPVKYGTPKLFTQSDPDQVHLYTVPTGRTYYVSSEPIETTDDAGDTIKILMASAAGPSGGSSTIGSYHVKEDERGADFVVDLAYVEMTTKASYEVAEESSLPAPKYETPGEAPAPRMASEPVVEIIESEPEEEMVDAYIPILQTPDLLDQYGPGSYGARGWANDQGTFYSLARTGSPEGYVSSGDPAEMLTFKSRASWTRTFTKQAGVADPTFHVEPSRLHVLDGLLDDRDLNALSEIRVEKRVHSVGAAWETVFYSMTEIAGYSIPSSGGDHTFKIVDHQGDQPQNDLKLIELFDTKGNLDTTIGAEYFQEAHDGTIPVGNLIDGESFEIRYTLKTQATSVPFDEFAEAFIGDPLDYGSGMRMQYGQYGEQVRIIGFLVGGDGAANVSYRSNSDFYFILTREEPGSEERTQVTMSLGHEGTGEFIDPAPPPDADAAFYLVENFPLGQPRDTDGDGIDDVYELQRSHLFNPLDATDADKDSDGDGLSDLAEYQQGSDPEIPDVIEPPNSDGHFPSRVADTGLDSGTVRLADLNGDGLLDAVALSGTFGAAALEAALANPDGTFQNPLSSALGNISALGFELYQLNNDTNPDAVILADPIIILLGDGNGNFNSSDSHSFDSILGVSSGDFNGDESQDLFLFKNSDKSLRLLENNGAGVFTEKETFTFDSTPWHAATGRWNDDALVDFAVTLQASQVAVFLGNETGFEEPQMFTGGASAERFGAGDVDGDGFTDIITANKGRDDISVILANGDGTLATEVRYPVGDTPRDVLVQDINGDTHLDLLVSHALSDFHSLFFGDNTGSFVEQENIWSSAGDRVVLEKWDSDDNPDLISPAGSGKLLVQPGDGAGLFDSRNAIPLSNAAIGDLQIANINGAGEDELLMMNLNTDEIDVWEHGIVSGTRQLLFSLAVPEQLEAFVVVDYNNDEEPDIIALSAEAQFGGSGENKLTVFQNDAGVFSNVAEIPLSARFTNMIAAEINGDVLRDIVVIARIDDSFTPENEVQALPLLNQGDGQFLPVTSVMPGKGINNVIAKDMNDDGVDELVMNGFFGTAALAVFKRNEDETWSNEQQFNISISDLIWADADNDDVGEFITTRQSGGTIVEMYSVNTSTGKLDPSDLLFSTGSTTGGIHFADIDGDSSVDLLLGNVEIYLASEEGGWESEMDRYYTGGTGIQVIDLNKDGRPDLVSWGLSGDSVGMLVHH